MFMRVCVCVSTVYLAGYLFADEGWPPYYYRCQKAKIGCFKENSLSQFSTYFGGEIVSEIVVFFEVPYNRKTRTEVLKRTTISQLKI